MASFSTSLEQALRRALQYANERSHEYATLEHLLLSLIDDRDAAAVMRACDVDLGSLRTTLTNWRLIASYHHGVPPDELARVYRS